MLDDEHEVFWSVEWVDRGCNGVRSGARVERGLGKMIKNENKNALTLPNIKPFSPVLLRVGNS
jgi:hypothetical protein